MGNLVIKTTLWPVCPLDIDSQGETEEAFNYYLSSFRRPFTEVGNYNFTCFFRLRQAEWPFRLAFFSTASFLTSRLRCSEQADGAAVPWQNKHEGQIQPPHWQRPRGFPGAPGLL